MDLAITENKYTYFIFPNHVHISSHESKHEPKCGKKKIFKSEIQRTNKVHTEIKVFYNLL